MSSNTPYTSPKSKVADMTHEVGELNMFTANGRIGRVRYLAWSMGFSILSMIILGAVVGLAGAMVGQGLAMTLYAIGVVGLLVVSAFFAIQRLHDLDQSGWLWLILMIPLIGLFFALYMMFAPGSNGANRYGNPPPPNTTGVVVLVWLMPVVMVGIIAAVAIPAYQGYVQKAQQAKMQSQPLEQQQ
jgi:uncharacterized membrane protein YhaH (DUF805 family)